MFEIKQGEGGYFCEWVRFMDNFKAASHCSTISWAIFTNTVSQAPDILSNPETFSHFPGHFDSHLPSCSPKYFHCSPTPLLAVLTREAGPRVGSPWKTWCRASFSCCWALWRRKSQGPASDLALNHCKLFLFQTDFLQIFCLVLRAPTASPLAECVLHTDELAFCMSWEQFCLLGPSGGVQFQPFTRPECWWNNCILIITNNNSQSSPLTSVNLPKWCLPSFMQPWQSRLSTYLLFLGT